MGREIEIIRTCEAVVVIGGRSGTPVSSPSPTTKPTDRGARGPGGIADHTELVGIIHTPTGAEIVSDADPETLFAKMLERHQVRLQNGLAYRGPVIHRD